MHISIVRKPHFGISNKNESLAFKTMRKLKTEIDLTIPTLIDKKVKNSEKIVENSSQKVISRVSMYLLSIFSAGRFTLTFGLIRPKGLPYK